MNHKRKRPKNRRAGCLLCKPQKSNGVNDKRVLGHRGFSRIRKEDAAAKELKAAALDS